MCCRRGVKYPKSVAAALRGLYAVYHGIMTIVGYCPGAVPTLGGYDFAFLE